MLVAQNFISYLGLFADTYYGDPTVIASKSLVVPCIIADIRSFTVATGTVSMQTTLLLLTQESMDSFETAIGLARHLQAYHEHALRTIQYTVAPIKDVSFDVGRMKYGDLLAGFTYNIEIRYNLPC